MRMLLIMKLPAVTILHQVMHIHNHHHMRQQRKPHTFNGTFGKQFSEDAVDGHGAIGAILLIMTLC